MISPALTLNSAHSGVTTEEDSAFGRHVFLILASVALVYAFFAGLRGTSDFDLGWQLATGRWVVQHHQVPSADVFSYTARGEPWIYPVGGGVIFYLAYLLGGYSLISWIGALACMGTVALLLRRGSAVSAAIAILAVPLIAQRTTPRADMFTVVLFAAFVSLLWENYRTGQARLWLLPVLMLAWVNLHFGFAAGLALIAAYVGAELLDAVLDATRRREAMARLQRAWIWLLVTVLVTLVNPWGWGIYRALLRQQRANAVQQALITEWTSVPVNWAAMRSAFGLRQTEGSIYLLLAIAVLAGLFALWKGKWGAALLLIAATYPAVRYARMGAVFACVVVVVAGPVLSEAIAVFSSRFRPARIGAIAGMAVVALLAVLASLRVFDLVTNRHYFQGTAETTFGPGVSWWFPQRAADFIEREDLPGEIFNTYNEGGYLDWRLGPQRLMYIDGRDTLFGVARIQRHGHLLQSSPDSPEWGQEAARYNINTIILPLGRYDGIQFVRLQDFCSSQVWQPVYLDEVSAVFVRRTPQTEELRQRFPVNCATAPIPAQAPPKNRAAAFNSWANAAGVLAALGRNSEALAATDNAMAIFSGSPYVHWQRANVLFAMGRMDDSEQEYLAAIALRPSDVTWSALAESYQKRGRIAAAIAALRTAAQLSPRPHQLWQNLGYLYLSTHQADEALKAFDAAARSAPPDMRAADGGTFDFMVAQGRSAAFSELGDLERAVAFQEKAAQIEPDAPEPWRRLAKLYRRAGRLEDATRADERAVAVEAKRSN